MPSDEELPESPRLDARLQEADVKRRARFIAIGWAMALVFVFLIALLLLLSTGSGKGGQGVSGQKTMAEGSAGAGGAGSNDKADPSSGVAQIHPDSKDKSQTSPPSGEPTNLQSQEQQSQAGAAESEEQQESPEPSETTMEVALGVRIDSGAPPARTGTGASTGQGAGGAGRGRVPLRLKGSKPHVLFVMDVSGSTGSPFQGTSIGDTNRDNYPDTVLDAQISAFITLNDYLISAGYGDTAKVFIVVFGNAAVRVNMDPSNLTIQTTTAPKTDSNKNGKHDVEEVLASITAGYSGAGGGTNFEAPLRVSMDIFTETATPSKNANVVFLSDGQGAGNFVDKAEALKKFGANIRAFGAGKGAVLNQLQQIDPDAQIFTSGDELVQFFGNVR